MIRLAIDTSTMTQSIALEVEGKVVSAREMRLRIGHSETLLRNVQETLASAEVQRSDIDEIVCGLGPGSFTGVRIGLSFALGVARARQIPIYGVDSMRAFLAYCPPALHVAVALDARKSEVYGVIYDATPDRKELLPASTYTPDEFFSRLREFPKHEAICVGNGAAAFPDAWNEHSAHIQAVDALRTPPATGLLSAHARGWSTAHHQQPLEPRYIRPSDAQMAKQP